MGTNYFLVTEAPCPTCGAGGPRRHIGKSSAGWVFSLHVYPEAGISTLYDWLPLLLKDGAVILDEYGKVVQVTSLLKCITCRSRSVPENTAAWYAKNMAVPGPNGLARHATSAGGFFARGPGTWDCMVGQEDSW